MIARRNLFTTGIFLFILGFVVPALLNVLIKSAVHDENQQSHITYYLFIVGAIIAIFIGVLLMVLGIFVPSKRNPGGKGDNFSSPRSFGRGNFGLRIFVARSLAACFGN